MNWDKIKESYPKGWEVFKKFCYIETDVFYDVNDEIINIYDSEIDFENVSGWLYKFFDENKICVFVRPVNILKSKDFIAIVFANQVMPYGKQSLHRNSFTTRSEAEKAAFKKAFEVLEQRLDS